MQVLGSPSMIPTSQAAGDCTDNSPAMTAPGAGSQNAPPQRPFGHEQYTGTVPVGNQPQPSERG